MGSIIKDNYVIVQNPINHQEINRLEVFNQIKVDNIILESKQYSDWANLSLSKRCDYIDCFRRSILRNKDEICAIIKEETGKKDFDILVELFGLLEHVKTISKIARKALKKSIRSSGLMKNKKAYVLYEPLGVAGIISPWNYPLTTPITTSVEALLSGNNVVLKPSEHTPLIALYIKKIWDDNINFKKAFNIIIGGGNVGQMIVDSDNIDVICFTGSTKVGQKIAQICAKTLKPFILELGGKDPMIILKDANLNRAVESALFAGFTNAGQTCISVEEVFVESNIFNQFVKLISNRVKQMSSGKEDNMEIGSMIMDANFNKVNEHIDKENHKGKIICGNKGTGDMYIAPTLVINPSKDSRIVNEETFGPVISIRSFDLEEDMIKMVHQTGYGLSASIFGRNKSRINQILKQLKIGNVSINDVFTHYGIASLPFGGEGLSGFGRSHGKEGLRSFCRIKSVVENKFSFLNEPWWYSRSKFVDGFLKKIINFLYK